MKFKAFENLFPQIKPCGLISENIHIAYPLEKCIQNNTN